MATVNDVKSTTLSGLNHIDALLNNLPNWNYLTSGGNNLYYTFSVGGNLETGNSSILSKPLAFSAAQQAATRGAINYLAQITGIKFTETNDTSLAQIHLANANISGRNTTGLDSSQYSYSYNSSNVVTRFTAATYVYLDNAEWASMNANLTPGTQGYETLLHELGHALGLKHSFDGAIKLPAATDNTAYTLMSYTHAGGVHSTFGEYDLAALKWLYGGDGLGGALGVNATSGGRYIAGTSLADTLTGGAANDVLEGGAGNDLLNGGAGTDTAYYNGARGAYTVTQTGATAWRVSGAEGTDTLNNIELLRFSDGTVALGGTGGGTPAPPDVTAPGRPTLLFARDGTAAASGNHPSFSGVAEAGAKVELFNGTASLGVATAAANGSWAITPVALANGSYHVTARATDAAGNVSAASLVQDFTVSSSLNLTGTAGADRLLATAGNNYIDGGAGTDTVVYAGTRAGYSVEKTPYGYRVTDLAGNGGSDLLVRDERIQFKDVVMTLDNSGIAAQSSSASVASPAMTDGAQPLEIRLVGHHALADHTHFA